MTVWSKLIPAVLVASIALAGCANGAKLAKAGVAGAAAAANTKPPLQVPAAFNSVAEKRDFAVKAVADVYYKEALPLLESTVASQPDATSYARLGTARYNLNNFAGAIEAWTKAVDLDPKLAGEMKNNIGNALRDSGKHEEAKATYREALKMEPTRWTAAINLALLLKSEDKVAEAVKVLETALAANKDIQPITSLLEQYKAETKG